MLFTSKSVADCLSTTPRAPSSIARTTSRSSSAAVSTITRVGVWSKFTSSSTASPSLSGMRRSSSRMSGFSLASSLMHSAPFCASPTMAISSSPSINLRSPSRKIAWSSAMSTRICCLVFAISAQRYLDRQARTMARVRFHGQHPPNRARSFLDGNWTQPQAVKLIPSEAAGEAEPLAVIVHHEGEPAVILRQFYHDMGSLRMLFYVVECFSIYLEDFPANPVRSMQIYRIHKQVQRQRGLVSKALCKAPHQVHQVRRLHAQGTQVRHEVPQLSTFVFHGLL